MTRKPVRFPRCLRNRQILKGRMICQRLGLVLSRHYTNHELESNSSTEANTSLSLTIYLYRALILPFCLPAEVEFAKL